MAVAVDTLDVVDDFLDDFEEGPTEMTFGLSAVRKSESLAARLATEHGIKGSIPVPLTIVEELLKAQAIVSKPEAKVEEAVSAPEGATAAAEDASEVAPAAEEEPDDGEPAQDDAEDPLQPEQGAMTGTIARFMPHKGYGFIKPDDGSEDVFIHIKQCNGAEELSAGDTVTFGLSWNVSKGKAQGDNCTVISADSAAFAPTTQADK